MAKKKRKSTPAPFNSQAAAEALIRYNPELSGLKALQQDAESTYGARVKAGNATSAALRSVIDAAVPDVRQAYADSATGIGDVNSLVKGDVAGLSGAGADRFKNAITTETLNFGNLLAGARANALTDLSRRKTSAAEGAKFSADQAGSDLEAALAKIGLRRGEIAKESGAFQQQRVGELAQEQDKQNFTASQNAKSRQNARVTAGVRADGSVIPGGKADKPAKKGTPRLPGGVKPQTTVAHSDLIDKLDKVKVIAAPLAKQAAKEGHSRHFVARLLTSGVKGGALHDTTTGKPKIDPNTGLAVEAPSIDAQDPLLTSITLDLIYDGHVSSANAKKLHRKGYSVKALGLPMGGGAADRARSRIVSQGDETLTRVVGALKGL